VSTFVEHLLRQRTVLIELGCVPEKRALLKPNMRDEDPF